MPILSKRYCDIYDDNCDSSVSAWLWGRWILFVIVLVFLFLLFGMTRIRRINKRRGNFGQQPIRGTAWMTPPSYFQSQRQYNQPVMNTSGPSDATYVPPYSENAQPTDAGYFDDQGMFHKNRQFASDGREIVEDDGVLPKPDGAYHHATNFEQDFPAFFGSNNRANTTELENLRPPGPPPPAEVGTSSSTMERPPQSHSKNG
ncbi:Rcr2 protein [Saccharomycopsis crataegensis]|uniref:Rcr2 protein n=1 Tax=Saccharomycopsis crataegensis TaxID=43959 RepID=A0AAV5QQF3_9ASCO|nr:Rcr2 protein [Saccharomycopsis crataegensis]